MSTNFKSRFKKLFAYAVLAFVVLFVFRLLYGYLATDTQNINNFGNWDGDFFSSIVQKNYASEKMKGERVASSPAVQTHQMNSQKYEKTASVKMKSHEFDQTEKQLKAAVRSFESIIQYEQNIGNKGNRELHLLIGVPPVLFDSFYYEVQKLGTIQTMGITKVDKTNEYRQLNAKKVSIEKTLQSLYELKSKGGQIVDFITLNERILEVEGMLQDLGVELGNFDEVNEFCTLKLSMYEGASAKEIRFIHRVKVAFEWTVKYFMIINIALLLVSISLFLLILSVDKLKVISRIKHRIDS